MKKIRLVLLLAIFISFSFSSVAVAYIVSVPDGSIQASGQGGYDYSISPLLTNAQGSSPVYVTGDVSLTGFQGVNAGWVTFGLITQAERDRALVTYGVPSYMFNHSVFMMAFNAGIGGSGFNVTAQPGDYAGDFPGGIGQAQNVSTSFSFNLKLVPNSGGTGGTAYLDTGSGYGIGLTYGKDNWANFPGWSGLPQEDLTNFYLIAQMYSWDANPGNYYRADFTNLQVSGDSIPTPIPGAVWLFGSGLIGLVGLRRKFRK